MAISSTSHPIPSHHAVSSFGFPRSNPRQSSAWSRDPIPLQTSQEALLQSKDMLCSLEEKENKFIHNNIQHHHHRGEEFFSPQSVHTGAFIRTCRPRTSSVTNPANRTRLGSLGTMGATHVSIIFSMLDWVPPSSRTISFVLVIIIRV